MNNSIYRTPLTRCTAHASFLLACAFGLFLSGCSVFGDANSKAVNIQKVMPTAQPTTLAIDAKQRVVLSNSVTVTPPKPPVEGKTSAIARLCAEPSPDVFSAIASSLSSSASAEKTDINTLRFALGLSGTSSESASTIERSQTANVLREVMYRNCERYMNGAMTDAQFIVQAARDQRMVISVLAIEQITGMAKAQATALTTVAKASTSASSAAEALQKAKDTWLAENKAAAAASAEADKAGAALSPPQTIANCDKPPTPAEADPNKTLIDTYILRCKDLSKATTASADAKKHYEKMDQLTLTGPTVSLESSGSLVSQEFTGTSANAKIAETVLKIVQENNSFNEVQMMCIAILQSPSITVDKILTACTSLVESGVNLEDSLVKRNIAETKKATEESSLKSADLRVNAEIARASLDAISWGIIFSSDGDIADAKDEMQNAKKDFVVPNSNLKNDVRLYKRGGYYATVIVAGAGGRSSATNPSPSSSNSK